MFKHSFLYEINTVAFLNSLSVKYSRSLTLGSIPEQEWDLQQLGFNYTYDKKLYDRLRLENPIDIREHLLAEKTYQEKSVRFIENHDEQRCVDSFGHERSKAAAVVAATVPGLCMFYDGQLDGNKIKIPVQLKRVNGERPSRKLQEFYQRLFSFCNGYHVRDAQWELLKADMAWDNNISNTNILCWQWFAENQHQIIVVNYSPVTSQGRIRIPIQNYGKPSGLFLDCVKKEEYVRDIEEINHCGLYVDLGAWDYHLLIFKY